MYKDSLNEPKLLQKIRNKIPLKHLQIYKLHNTYNADIGIFTKKAYMHHNICRQKCGIKKCETQKREAKRAPRGAENVNMLKKTDRTKDFND